MATAQLDTLIRHMKTLAAGEGTSPRTDGQLLDDFLTADDESAFAELVTRHGSMVLRVCRRVLRHEQDAEDAFQASFLILAQYAGAVRKRESVASWLHGVAYRTAMKAKRSAARRRNHESRLKEQKPTQVLSPTWDDVQTVLDEEIRRLPETFRSAFVLCVLEGKSLRDAGVELECKEGTVSSRLVRARERLRRQLARRGIELSALLAALAVAESNGRASVPAPLIEATIRSAFLLTAGESAGLIPPHVAALAAGAHRIMLSMKIIRIATALMLVLGVMTGAALLRGSVLAGKPGEEQPPPQPQAPEGKGPKAPADPKQEAEVVYHGRVLDSDGRPVAGAKLYLSPGVVHHNRRSSAPENTTTGTDGRFEFAVPEAKVADWFTFVAATASNHGLGWVMVAPGGQKAALTVRLVKDDVPILGQIVDLEGKPVAGATLTVLVVNAAPGEDLGPWLEAIKSRKEQSGPSLRPCGMPLSPKVTTDADGRFRLTGIGRDRLVRVQLDGPGIASQYLNILTRSGKSIEVPESKGRLETTTYYGASFRHPAAPTRPTVGVVRDRDTQKPLAGVTIESNRLANNPIPGLNIVETRTDEKGHYHLVGMPKGEGNRIRLVPRDDQPYVSVNAAVPDSPGLDPVTVDFELKRGVWIEGKLTDKVTGKPVQAYVEYFALQDNPNLHDFPGFVGTVASYTSVLTKLDGSYRMVGLPGPGLIAVHYDGGHLLVPERDDEYGNKEKPVLTAPSQIAPLINYTALARIEPAKGVEKVTRDVTLDPGWTFTGTVLGPDGKPLTGVRVFGLSHRFPSWDRAELTSAAFTVRAFNPHRPRDVFFQHPQKGLVGVAQQPKENGESVTVRMEPGATVTGRLVDVSGKPRAGVELEVRFRLKRDPLWDRYPREGRYPHELIKTDQEGRFRIEALLPDREFRLTDGKAELPFGALRSGQTKDLGDVQVKGREE
jgi:RNA polymerase sigma factor (sigma-70 family)